MRALCTFRVWLARISFPCSNWFILLSVSDRKHESLVRFYYFNICLTTAQPVKHFFSRLSGLSPLLGDDDSETLTNVTSGEWDFDQDSFGVISDQAKDFISALLVKNPR